MYTVNLYEEDRKTLAGQRRFNTWEECDQFARLNQPCVVFADFILSTDGICSFHEEVSRYGMEDEE